MVRAVPSALRRQRQEGQDFKASLGYIIPVSKPLITMRKKVKGK